MRIAAWLLLLPLRVPSSTAATSNLVAFVSHTNTGKLQKRYTQTNIKMSTPVSMDSPSAHRNKDPIWQVIQKEILPLLPQDQLTVMEIAAGCGVHCEHFASKMNEMNPNLKLKWYPTDPDPPSLQALQERISNLGNIELKKSIQTMPLTLNEEGIMEDETSKIINQHSESLDPIHFMVCINMIHISPWTATLGLFHVASACLAKDGVLMTYGPYKENGTAVESNLRFDASLKSRNVEWGVRDIEKVIDAAESQGFSLKQKIEMPANNLCLIFQKKE